MAAIIWQGAPFNREVLAEAYLEESGGSRFLLSDGIAGDIAIVPAKAGMAEALENGKRIAMVAGDDSTGTITIPLFQRALSDVCEISDPTLPEILHQKNLGTTFAPYTTLSGTDSDGTVAPLTMSPRLRCWKIVIKLQPRRGGDVTATKGTKITCYALFTNPDLSVVNVGGVSQFSLTGTIPRDFCLDWTNY